MKSICAAVHVPLAVVLVMGLPPPGRGVVERGRVALDGVLGTGVEIEARKPVLGAGAGAEDAAGGAVAVVATGLTVAGAGAGAGAVAGAAAAAVGALLGINRSCEDDNEIDEAADRLLSRDKSV